MSRSTSTSPQPVAHVWVSWQSSAATSNWSYGANMQDARCRRSPPPAKRLYPRWWVTLAVAPFRCSFTSPCTVSKCTCKKKKKKKLFEGLQDFPHKSSWRQRSSTYRKTSSDPKTKAVSTETKSQSEQLSSLQSERERKRERQGAQRQMSAPATGFFQVCYLRLAAMPAQQAGRVSRVLGSQREADFLICLAQTLGGILYMVADQSRPSSAQLVQKHSYIISMS